MRLSRECQLLVLRQWRLHRVPSVINAHVLIVWRHTRKSCIIRDAARWWFTVTLQLQGAEEEMQASFMFVLVVRAPVYMRLHYLTGSCVLGPFLTDLYINPWVQSRLTFFTLNSLSCSIHNLEGSMFISEQDTRINPQGQIHFWAPVDIPLCVLGVF